VRKDLASAVAAILGSLPGFTLPFVAALVLSPHDSDLLLLAVSVAVTQAVIVTSAADLTTIAEYGRLLGRGVEPSPVALRAYRWRVLRFALLLTVVVTPALTIAYAARSTDRAEFVGLVAAVAATPVLAALAAMLSGECVARGAPVVPIAVQAVRSLVPALLLVAWPSAPLWLVAAALPVGEVVRGVILWVSCRRLRRAQVGAAQEHTDVLPAHGLLAQATSQGVTQLGPAVDRVFLASSGAGYISAYEMADRLMYAAAQFFSLTFVYRRVAVWARLPAIEPDRARRLLRRDARTLGVASAVLTLAGVLGCGVALASGLLPPDWTRGFWWGALVMLSVPAHGFNVVGTRMLVVARKQHLMLWIAIATAALNAVLDTAFYLWLGPIGIVVGTVVLRWVMAGVYLALLRKVVPQTIGQDLAEQPHAGRHRA
jgi:O-antigen/teichoic acid export membrane protein